jgi:hypothetical protein
MDKNKRAIKYLNTVRTNTHITLLILIGGFITTFILMLYFPIFFIFNPLMLIVTGFYAYYMSKKLKFLTMIDRVLHSDNASKLIDELHSNLSDDLDKSKPRGRATQALYMGERTYNRTEVNSFIAKRIDVTIVRNIYRIYSEPE